MNLQEITKQNIDIFCKTNKEFNGYTSELIKFGHNRAVFLLVGPNGEKYVAKIGNETKDSGSSNANDVMVQTFLNEKKLDFVPKIVYWDEKTDMHVESFVGTSDIDADDLDKKGLDIFAHQLATVHSLSLADFIASATKNGFAVPKQPTALSHLKVFGFERLKTAKALCPDTEVIKWLEYQLKLHEQEIKSTPPEEPHLVWGDIGENLRIGKNKLFFIDWEFGGLGYGHELAYIKIHSHLSADKFKHFMFCYSQYSGVSIKELKIGINRAEKVTRTNDVVWAAMKWAQSKSSSEKEKYKGLTYKRRNVAREIIGK